MTIAPDAPPGPVTLTLTGTTTRGGQCNSQATVTVEECVDLDFGGVPDNNETDPGGFLCLNDDDDNGNGVPDKDEPGPTAGENDLIALTVSIAPALTGTVTLSAIAGATRIKLYENADRSNPVTLPKAWTVPTGLPETLYVEGFNVSIGARDIELKVLFTGSGGPCEDRVKLTVVQVDLDIDSDNNNVIEPADEPLEENLPGKILKVTGVAEIKMSTSFQPQDPSTASWSITWSPPTRILVVDGLFANGVQEPWPPEPSALIFAVDPGELTMSFQIFVNNQSIACVDTIVATVCEEFTATPLPGMTFTAQNFAVQTDAPSPRPISNPVWVGAGFGAIVPNGFAVEWNPTVDVQSTSPNVSCDQFTIGVIQTMLSWQSTYVYTDGNRIWSGTVPSLDQFRDDPGPGAFYRPTSTMPMSACGNTGALVYGDTPSVEGTWTNWCTQPNGGDLTSITFVDSVETWLVALHNPSGCYTVIKHFTWTQQGQTSSVDAFNMTFQSTSSTTVSGVDNGPGGTPVLHPPDFNGTINGQCIP